jgi:uracil-DNA glycosylase family 4
LTGSRRSDAIDALESRIVGCRRCPRLVRHREAAAHDKVRRFAHWDYWGKPVPGFGDPRARLWIVGLAPAAHGGNRTGRIFTGDRSGDWLYAALHRAGLANQPTSVSRDDGLVLRGVWVSAVVRCAPPDNRPSTEERDRCLPYLAEELRLLERVEVFVALGAFAFTNVLRLLRQQREHSGALPAFGHGTIVRLQAGRTLIGCYHPSQQNTFTGRLTERMLDEVIGRAQRLLARGPGRRSRGSAVR